MKKMMRIGAAVCIIAAFTSFSPVEEKAQTTVESPAVEVIACVK